MTSHDPQRCCEAVRSAILATAWLLVVNAIRCFRQFCSYFAHEISVRFVSLMYRVQSVENLNLPFTLYFQPPEYNVNSVEQRRRYSTNLIVCEYYCKQVERIAVFTSAIHTAVVLLSFVIQNGRILKLICTRAAARCE